MAQKNPAQKCSELIARMRTVQLATLGRVVQGREEHAVLHRSKVYLLSSAVEVSEISAILEQHDPNDRPDPWRRN